MSKNSSGKIYYVNIEGVEHTWNQDTITVAEIAELGGWDPSSGVIEVDKHNNERTIPHDEVVKIKPGHGFGKKHVWKRG